VGRQPALARRGTGCGRALLAGGDVTGSVWALGTAHGISGCLRGSAGTRHPPALAYIEVGDERLAGLGEGGAGLAVLDHVEPVGFPEVGELPVVPQGLPQGAVPLQGHPAGGTVPVTGCHRRHAAPMSAPRVPVPPGCRSRACLPASPAAMLSSQGTAKPGT